MTHEQAHELATLTAGIPEPERTRLSDLLRRIRESDKAEAYEDALTMLRDGCPVSEAVA